MYDIKNCSDLTILASRLNVTPLEFDRDFVMSVYDNGLIFAFTRTVINKFNVDLGGMLSLEPDLSGLEYESKELYLIILDSANIKKYLFTEFRTTDDILKYIQNNMFSTSQNFCSDVSVFNSTDFEGFIERFKIKIQKNKRLDDKLIGLVDITLKNLVGIDDII